MISIDIVKNFQSKQRLWKFQYTQLSDAYLQSKNSYHLEHQRREDITSRLPLTIASHHPTTVDKDPQKVVPLFSVHAFNKCGSISWTQNGIQDRYETKEIFTDKDFLYDGGIA